jgi:hypothetical protein
MAATHSEATKAIGVRDALLRNAEDKVQAALAR